jgi:hypothetical protein
MKRKEKHTFYNYQFKHTAVKITDHPNIHKIGSIKPPDGTLPQSQ